MMDSVLSVYQRSATKFMPWLVAVMVATAIISSHGAQPVAALLFLSATPLMFIARPERLQVTWPWVLAFVLPLLVSIPLFVSSGTGEALAGGARYLLALLTLYGLCRIRLQPFFLLRAASAAGILTIVVNIGDIVDIDEARVNWGVGFLDSAYIGVMLLAISLAQFHCDRDRFWWRVFAVVGSTCLIFVTLKTGTRGAWPGLILVCFLQLVILKISRARKILLALVGLMIFALVIYSTPSLKHRVDQAVDDVSSYYIDNNPDGSIGHRLVFWYISMDAFMDGPIFGVSYPHRSKVMAQYTMKHPESISIGQDGRSSSHNELLNALSKRGLAGAIAVLLLYLVPLRYFASVFRSADSPTIRQVGLAGAGVVLSIILCGMSEAPMMNVRVGTTYGFLLILLYHLAASANPSRVKSTAHLSRS